MYGYVYKVTNCINGKIYIGQKKAGKFVEHYYGSGKLILQAIEKYGKENFTREVLQWCESLRELNEAEVYWIEKLNSRTDGNGYNISAGGTGRLDTPESRKQLSSSLKLYYSIPENRQKQSDSHKGIPSSIKGQTASTCESIQRMVETRKRRIEGGHIQAPMQDKHHSQTTLQLMSECKRGDKNPFYGKHHTDTAKKSMSEKLTGRTISDSQRKQISIANSGENNGMYGKEPVNKNKICITDGQTNKYVRPSELAMYEEQGWRRGSTQNHHKQVG